MKNTTNEIFITLPDFYWFSLKAIGQEYGREMKALLSQPIPEFNYEPTDTDLDKLDYQLEDLTNSMVSSEFNMYMLHHTFSESDAFEDYMNEALGLTSTQALDLLLAVALQDNVDQIKIDSNKLIINLNVWGRFVLEDILADSSYWEERAVPHSIEQYFKLMITHMIYSDFQKLGDNLVNAIQELSGYKDEEIKYLLDAMKKY